MNANAEGNTEGRRLRALWDAAREAGQTHGIWTPALDRWVTLEELEQMEHTNGTQTPMTEMIADVERTGYMEQIADLQRSLDAASKDNAFTLRMVYALQDVLAAISNLSSAYEGAAAVLAEYAKARQG